MVNGSGHLPHARKPVQFNLALRDFCEDAFARAHAARPDRVPPGRAPARAVHLLADRARALPSAMWRSRASCAALNPDLQIDWLAQDPVTRVLEAEGERIHPASSHLASESRAHRVGVGRA